MGKGQIIQFHGEADDLVSRVKLNAKELDKKAQLIVGTHVVGLVAKLGVLDNEPLKSGAYQIFDKKDKLMRKMGSIDGLEIIFIATESEEDFFWGTADPINIEDPDTKIVVKISANGRFKIRISDPMKFYKVLVKHALRFTTYDLEVKLLDVFMAEFRPTLSRVMRANDYSYVNITDHQKDISQGLENEMRNIFQDYGVEMVRFLINNIELTNPVDGEKIERAKETLRHENKNEQKRQQLRTEAREDIQYSIEIAEKIGNNAFEKEKYMMELASSDYDKYLAVCKHIGWEPKSKTVVNSNPSGNVCSKCGKQNQQGTVFCGKCGKKL